MDRYKNFSCSLEQLPLSGKMKETMNLSPLTDFHFPNKFEEKK